MGWLGGGWGVFLTLNPQRFFLEKSFLVCVFFNPLPFSTLYWWRRLGRGVGRCEVGARSFGGACGNLETFNFPFWLFQNASSTSGDLFWLSNTKHSFKPTPRTTVVISSSWSYYFEHTIPSKISTPNANFQWRFGVVCIGRGAPPQLFDGIWEVVKLRRLLHLYQHHCQTISWICLAPNQWFGRCHLVEVRRVEIVNSTRQVFYNSVWFSEQQFTIYNVQHILITMNTWTQKKYPKFYTREIITLDEALWQPGIDTPPISLKHSHAQWSVEPAQYHKTK